MRFDFTFFGFWSSFELDAEAEVVDVVLGKPGCTGIGSSAVAASASAQPNESDRRSFLSFSNATETIDEVSILSDLRASELFAGVGEAGAAAEVSVLSFLSDLPPLVGAGAEAMLSTLSCLSGLFFSPLCGRASAVFAGAGVVAVVSALSLVSAFLVLPLSMLLADAGVEADVSTLSFLSDFLLSPLCGRDSVLLDVTDAEAEVSTLSFLSDFLLFEGAAEVSILSCLSACLWPELCLRLWLRTSEVLAGVLVGTASAMGTGVWVRASEVLAGVLVGAASATGTGVWVGAVTIAGPEEETDADGSDRGDLMTDVDSLDVATALSAAVLSVHVKRWKFYWFQSNVCGTQTRLTEIIPKH